MLVEPDGAPGARAGYMSVYACGSLWCVRRACLCFPHGMCMVLLFCSGLKRVSGPDSWADDTFIFFQFAPGPRPERKPSGSAGAAPHSGSVECGTSAPSKLLSTKCHAYVHMTHATSL